MNLDNPSIAVLFTNSASCDRKSPFRKLRSSKVYSIFSRKAEKAGLNVFVAHRKEYRDGKLKRCWCRINNKWKIFENQEVDVVYSRFAASIYRKNRKNKVAEKFKYRMAKHVTVLNHPLLDEFCWDKKMVAETFPEHCPRTFVINTKKGLDIILPEIKTEKIVIKPRYGTLGKSVIITDKQNLPEKIEKNTIVQEFIDTSKGIKGITDGLHDMRLVMINGKLDHAHIRVPKKGLLTANVALGGKKIFIKNRVVPKKALSIAKKVDKIFKPFCPRIYSVDFLFDKRGKPYIVECNSQPMIDKYAYGKYAMIDFYDRVIDALKSGVKVKLRRGY